MDTVPWLAATPAATFPLDDHGEGRWLHQIFELDALQKGRPVRIGRADGKLRLTPAGFAARLAALGGAIVRRSEDLSGDAPDDDDDDDEIVYVNSTRFEIAPCGETASLECVWGDAVLGASIRKDRAEIRFATSGEARWEALHAFARECIGPTPPRSLHVLALDHGQLRARSLAVVQAPLERGNYATGVLGAFDHVVRDLGSPEPCGRLVLVEGPPGVGKTHLVRGLCEAAQGALFLVIPVASVADLEGPNLLSLLIGMTARHPRRPLCLVMEDADSCLVPRQTDNLDVISTLLNLSDGLLGAALNLRIVATTNARVQEIDAAILRPGRLCRRITIAPLRPDEARAVLGRLGGADRHIDRPMTLAEIYAAAVPTVTSTL